MKSLGSIRRDFAPWNDPNAKPYIAVRERHQEVRRLHRRQRRLSLDIYEREFFCAARRARAAASRRCCACWPASRSRPPGRILLDGQDMARHAALRAAGQHDVPVLRAVPAHDGREEHRLRPEAGRHAEAGDRRRASPRCWSWSSSSSSPSASRTSSRAASASASRWRAALVKRPKVLLLDEPLGALDKKLREETQFELMDIQEKLGVTFIVVTHDQEEAMTLADPHRRHGPGRDRAGRHAGRDLRVRRTRASSPTSSATVNMFEGTDRRAARPSTCQHRCRRAGVDIRVGPRRQRGRWHDRRLRHPAGEDQGSSHEPPAERRQLRSRARSRKSPISAT